jgi:NADP-dependent 3-hydroxy acid dehydrogenase YdfG
MRSCQRSSQTFLSALRLHDERSMTSSSSSPQNPSLVDPRAQGPKPDYPQPLIDPPGLESEMVPRADHGEESYRGFDRLRDRVALITGGDSGIGRAVALAYAREGADVVISYMPEEETDAIETCRWVEDAGRKAVRIAGDIQREAHCIELVERVFRELGRLDVLVNNAAFQRTHDALDEFSTEELEQTFRTNVYAMFWLCRAALPRMAAGGVILNTASIQAFDPSPNLLLYAATKATIINFTKALSQLAMKQAYASMPSRPGLSGRR